MTESPLRHGGAANQAYTGAEVAEGLGRSAPEGLETLFGAAEELAAFRRREPTLPLRDRRRIVDQALVLLEGNYVHLPHKAAMYAVDPVQRLRLLRARLEARAEAGDELPPAAAFHAEMSEIFHSLRDLHTNYLLPDPYRGQLAFLPFLVEEFFEDGAPRYVVTKVMAGAPGGTFGRGVVVTHWNGMPIERAIEVNAARFAGSNEAARHARGVDSLTIRPLRVHRHPDEDWVVVGYLQVGGPTDDVTDEVRLPWLVAPNLPPVVGDVAPEAGDPAGVRVDEAATAIGVDLDLDEVQRARKLLFAPQVAAAEVRGVAAPAPAANEVATSLPGVFRARRVTVDGVEYGHLRIFTFSVDDPGAFVAEFVRLTGRLPGAGLVLDVRGNGGGHIWAAELTLQTLTPHPVTPEPTQFVNTEVNGELCRQHDSGQGGIDLGAWLPSIEQSVTTGAAYSNAFSITPAGAANAVGQRYHGPVVLVTDARCYSATDIFAAGFADHEIGPVLGVDRNTGAGGANVWTHGLLRQLYRGRAGAPSPYRELPDGVDMRVSIRRTLRVGDLAGTPVEDLGVQPDHRHPMTRRDVEEGNPDLLEHAVALLRGLPVRRLDVTSGAVGDDGKLALSLEVAGVDRLDVYADDRPVASQDVAGAGAVSLVVPAAGAGRLRIDGFAQGTLVASRREVLGRLESGAVGVLRDAALAPAPASAVPRRLRFLVHAPGAEAADVRRRAREALGGRTAVEPLFAEPVPRSERAAAPEVAATPELAEFHAVTATAPGAGDVERRAAAFELARALQELTGWDVQPDLASGAMYPPRAAFDLELQDPTALAGDAHLAGTDDAAWALERLRVPAAWAASPGRGRGVLVAQPDTGVTAHPELRPGIDTARQRDLLDDDGDATDPLTKRWWWMDNPSHGTATSSVVFSRSPAQVTGSAPEATLVPLRSNKSVVLVLDGDVARAIEHARRTGCHVITMSLGGVGFSPALRTAIRAAIRDGLIVLAAAGNQVGFVVSPANFDEVIAVAATNVQDRPWSGSSHGDAVDVAAPGESVWTARARRGSRGNEYFTSRGSGTSFAVALTAGVAALWLEHHGRDALVRRYGADRIHPLFADLLRRTARRPAGWNAAEYGDGIVDAAALLAAPLPATAPALDGVAAGTLSAEERLAAYLPGRSVATASAALDALLPGAGKRELFAGEIAYHVSQSRLVRDAVLAAGGAVTDGAGEPLRDPAPGVARLRALASPSLATAMPR